MQGYFGKRVNDIYERNQLEKEVNFPMCGGNMREGIKLSNGCVIELDDKNAMHFWYYIPNKLVNRISLDTVGSMANPLRSEILDAIMKLTAPPYSMADWWEIQLRSVGDRGQVCNDAEWHISLCDELNAMKEDRKEGEDG